MPLGTEVGLGPGDTVLDADPASPMERGTAATHFSAHVYCGKRSPISATAKLLISFLSSGTICYTFGGTT